MAAARICSPQPAAPLDRGGGGPGVVNIIPNKWGGVVVRGGKMSWRNFACAGEKPVAVNFVREDGHFCSF